MGQVLARALVQISKIALRQGGVGFTLTKYITTFKSVNTKAEFYKLIKKMSLEQFKRNIPFIYYVDKLSSRRNIAAKIEGGPLWKYYIKSLAKNKLVPKEILKWYYFFDYVFKQERVPYKDNDLPTDKTKTSDKNSFINELNKLNSNADKINAVTTVINTLSEEQGLQFRRRYMNEGLFFKVNSPTTQNFSQEEHMYNFYKEVYVFPIRGWGGKKIKNYSWRRIDYRTIILPALSGQPFGENIYSIIRNEPTFKHTRRDIALNYVSYATKSRFLYRKANKKV